MRLLNPKRQRKIDKSIYFFWFRKTHESTTQKKEWLRLSVRLREFSIIFTKVYVTLIFHTAQKTYCPFFQQVKRKTFQAENDSFTKMYKTPNDFLREKNCKSAYLIKISAKTEKHNIMKFMIRKFS